MIAGRYRTSSGIGVGTSESQLLAVFPGSLAKRTDRAPNFASYDLQPSPGKHAVFYVEDGRVILVIAGNMNQLAAWEEGICY